MSADAFLSAMSDEYGYDFIKKIPDREFKYKLQGFLFPQTYEFFKTAAAHEIIDTMLGEFEKQYSKMDIIVGQVKSEVLDTDERLVIL